MASTRRGNEFYGNLHEMFRPSGFGPFFFKTVREQGLNSFNGRDYCFTTGGLGAGLEISVAGIGLSVAGEGCLRFLFGG
jgi:hypothetical protein